MALLHYLKKQLASDGVHYQAGESGVFVSGVVTGTGGAQNTAHGLGGAPTVVVIALVGGPAVYVQPVVTEGAHDATNCVVTVTANWQYRIIAFA